MSEEVREWLERSVTEEEVKEEVWDCDGNKSPGPDGFTLEFFKVFGKRLREMSLLL